MGEKKDEDDPPTDSRPTFWLMFSVISAAFGSSFLFGYNIGVLNPTQNVIGLWIRQTKCLANGGIPSEDEGEMSDLWCAKLNEHQEATMFTDNTELNTLWALLNSLVPGGSVIGALMSSYIVDRFGPKRSMLFSNIVAIIAVVLNSLARTAGSVEMLIVGRCIAGINIGLIASATPTYLNEISPVRLRGSIGAVHPLCLVTGILVSQILGLPSLLGNSAYWPYLLALAGVTTLYQMITLPFCPDSPKFLYFQRQDEKAARKALKRLVGSANVDREMELNRREYESMKEEPAVSVRELFTDPFLRRTLLITFGLMACQELLSGIDAVLFYSTSIFRSAGLLGDNALYATLALSGMFVLGHLVSLVLVERAGRRMLLLMGYAGAAFFLVILTISMLLFKNGLPGPENPNATNSFGFAAYVSTVSLIGFVAMVAIGPGAIPWILMSEYFTQGPRAAAGGIIAGVNRFSSLILTLTFPYLQAAIDEYCFVIFAATNIFCIGFTFLYVVETKGKTSDQIQRDLRRKMPQRYLARQEIAMSSLAEKSQSTKLM